MSHFLYAQPSPIWISVWVGTALLAISLLVLARLRWTQSRPVSICVVLSVFAHILLILSASVTDLIDPPPPPADHAVIRVSLSDDDTVDARLAQGWPDFQPDQAATVRLEAAQPADRWPDPEATPHDNAPTVSQVSDIAEHVAGQPAPGEVPPPSEAGETPDTPTQPGEPAAPIEASPADVAPGDESLPATVQPDTPGQAAEPSATEPPASEEPPQESAVTAAASGEAELPPGEPSAAEVSADVSDQHDAPPPYGVAEGVPAEVIPGESAETQPAETQPVGESSPPSTTAAAVDDRTWQSATAGSHGGHAGSPSASANPPDSGAVGSSMGRSIARRWVDGQPLPEAYRLRVAPDRLDAAAARGATVRTEQAVSDALDWLARTQSPDGRWDASATGAGQETRVGGQDRAGTGLEADTGITGLAVLALLGAGQTHLDGQHREVVQHGLEFLLRSQRADGNMAGLADRYAAMYCHGIATMAIGEGLAMTGDPRLAPYVRRAAAYTVSAQDPITGGWRYGPGEPGDTSQFGWQLMALTIAEHTGVPISPTAREGMQRFLASVSSGRYGGLAAYRPLERGQATRSMTAEALACRLFLGGPLDRLALEEAADYILQLPPGTGPANLYYWYYATLGLSQLDDQLRWEAWDRALKLHLLATQRTDGQARGSWDTNTVWGGHGGRAYTTSLAALCLEAYYRYHPSGTSHVARRP